MVTERQRMRLRDGARQVRLLQDAGNNTLWSERYILRSWEEYLRQGERQTFETKWLDDVLAELHEGDSGPGTRSYFERRKRLKGNGPIANYPPA